MNTVWREALIAGERMGARYRLALPREALRGAGGYRLGRLSGASLDFMDYREYQPGDDLRSLDWNVFARSDRLMVKMRHEEVHPRVDIALDTSLSMDLPETPKARAALLVAATLAMAAGNARCAYSVWQLANGALPVRNGSLPPSQWDGLAFDHGRRPEEAFRILPPRFRRNGVRILISDLLWPGDPMATLRPLAAGAARVTVVQILAESDSDPGGYGHTRLADVETGERRDVYLDERLRQRYREALARHSQQWNLACRQSGATLATLTAEETARAPALRALEESGLLEAV